MPVQYIYTSTPFYVPYSLYRVSVPVQYNIPLLPFMCRTACTESQCLYSIIYLYSPYGPYCLYRTSLPVQYSYTYTPPMCRTA